MRMHRRGHTWLTGAAAALVALGFSTTTAVTAAHDARAAATTTVAPPIPRAPTSTSGLADQTLRDIVDRLTTQRAADSTPQIGAPRVVVDADLAAGASRAAVGAAIAALGGTVTGHVAERSVEASVPYTRVAALASLPSVQFLHAPGRTAPAEASPASAIAQSSATAAVASPIAGQEVSITGAAAWHRAGFTGGGVRVGIIDQFNGSGWSAARARGEVPTPAGTFCRSNGQACNVFASGIIHGVAVAEVIHDMAPGATLYLASARSAADFQAAVTYFASVGVRIISHSETAEYDGNGSGSGDRDAVVAQAVARGITWFQSAGNNHPGGIYPGGYYRSLWHPGTGVNAAFFNFGTDAKPDFSLRAACGFFNGLRWDDFASSNPTDYAVDVYRDGQVNVAGLIKTLDSHQSAGGVPPIELMNTIPCPAPVPASGRSMVEVVIRLISAGNGAANDTLELGSNGFIEGPKPTEFYGATGPFSDSSSTGMLSVGAIGDNPFGAHLAPYSSLGPTNDGRIKPDISAPTCLSDYSYPHAPAGQRAACFSGTSAATPVVAGAAALVLQARLATSPASMKAYLQAHAIDLGFFGRDIGFGAGEVHLPAPPGDHVKPRVVAKTGQKLKRGTTAKLQYFVSDNSNVTRDAVRVTRGSRVLLTLTTGFGPDTGHHFYFPWRVPRTLAPGPARLCVTATDRARNSAVNCATVSITR